MSGNELWIRSRQLDKADDFPQLVALLGDPEMAQQRSLRGYILMALSRWPDPVATTALIDAYRSDPSVKNRRVAAYLLSERGERDVEPVLIDALKDDDQRTRIHAARGLSRTGSERAVAALVAALDDPSGGVREDAVSALGRIGGPEVVEPLTRALEDKRLLVRLRATRNLARVGAKSALPVMRRARDHTWPPWRFFMSADIRALQRQ